MSEERVQLPPGWKLRLSEILQTAQMQSLRAFLRAELQAGKRIFPPAKLIFNALEHTDFDAVKVVILGQDPYPAAGQAHGLSFSVPDGVAVPRSLANIYRELASDLGQAAPAHGNLESWAAQGVLLLNAVLTVEAGRPDSHKGQGWERFTDAVIEALNHECEGLVFMLWGRNAQLKGSIVSSSRHLVLKAAHPSPLSAHNGFFGCRHFSQANEYLQKHGKAPINWSL